VKQVVCIRCNHVRPKSPCADCWSRDRHQRLTTTQRGYGTAHQAQRSADLKGLVPGQLCPLCGKGMYPKEDLQRHHVIAIYDGGMNGPGALVHRACNIRVENQRRAQRRKMRGPSWRKTDRNT